MTRIIKDLSNKRFGRLIAIEATDKRHDSKVIWKCKCDCGEECFVVSRSLVLGHTKSCGCLRKELLQRGLSKLEFGFSAFNQLYNNYKRSAELRNYSFNLSRDSFYELTQKNCFYCGETPKQKQSGKHLNGFYLYNGIDRIDNSRGYTLENCVPCCKTCNRAKDVMSQKEFLSWIKKIYKFQILNLPTNGN